ncbi:SGNH/GDSL hydrolase family protein [Agromyces indicus]|uniref:SGNH/GDSL hydrolase family protein n=1 Tax=Agromyces indicus TaxID=758919 RepID=A0ABU1FHY5_9MICO|nr:SGNH/GDSL hydrolase family protein [Agromyces indicus]MDR5691368.1 SGNH/GDSL hydrolase family protein [Agromyces indicus]
MAATAWVLLGCAPSGSAPSGSDASPDRPAASDTDDPDRAGGTFAAVGDSITDADSRNFAAGEIGPASWAACVVDAGFVFAGGWAEWGATTARMADAAAEVDADTLVVLAGTNDVAFGIPFAETSANLERIVDAVGIDDVVVSSIPPIDAFPQGPVEFNEQLAEFADERGWRFVDAAAGLRTSDGTFRSGLSFDGLHPSEDGARVLGEAIADELVAG